MADSWAGLIRPLDSADTGRKERLEFVKDAGGYLIQGVFFPPWHGGRNYIWKLLDRPGAEIECEELHGYGLVHSDAARLRDNYRRTVCGGIKRAITELIAFTPTAAVGVHLHEQIKTGHRCVYLPRNDWEIDLGKIDSH